MREGENERRLEYEKKIDDLKSDMLNKDDEIRRSNFEMERQVKLAQISANE